ncbi:MAG: hypothetical protein JKY31_12470 [Rhodobacteraceae bacterium]|nr:hypothetical protein [Paracoccaceae bacterium]
MTRYAPFLTAPTIAALLFVAHLSGLWTLLGSHPFWSASATYLGLAAGLVVVVLIWGKPGWGVLILLFLLTALAFYASTKGKEVFVGSYAENSFAGRIWYFGFIGFIAGLFASLVGLVSAFLPTPRS